MNWGDASSYNVWKRIYLDSAVCKHIAEGMIVSHWCAWSTSHLRGEVFQVTRWCIFSHIAFVSEKALRKFDFCLIRLESFISVCSQATLLQFENHGGKYKNRTLLRREFLWSLVRRSCRSFPHRSRFGSFDFDVWYDRFYSQGLCMRGNTSAARLQAERRILLRHINSFENFGKYIAVPKNYDHFAITPSWERKVLCSSYSEAWKGLHTN